MEEDKAKTFFASPERSSMEEVKEESKLFFDGSLFENLSDAIPSVFVILNQNRQIVFTNNRLVELLGLNGKECLLGKRPGEALNCAYADKNDAGCGTSEFCSQCGAVKAILTAIKGISNIGECSILTKDNNAINLRVWATPFTIEEKRYVAFSVLDINSEKLVQTLQRTFLHDIANIAGGVSGLTELLTSPGNTHMRAEYTKMLQDTTKKLIAEIETQRELNKITRGEFNISIDIFSSISLLKSVITLYQPNEIARGKSIAIAAGAADKTVSTDQTLLLRVIGNMTKNALEASDIGQAVNLNCIEEADSMIFSVSNKKFMPREIQLQVFKRSFSTKGTDRGIGTYSMKLIGENFLHGSVYFESDEVKGTTFYIKIPKSIRS